MYDFLSMLTIHPAIFTHQDDIRSRLASLVSTNSFGTIQNKYR